MKYFSEKNEVIDIPLNAYAIGHGSFGDIYPLKSNQCIKIFKDSGMEYDFDVLKEIKNLHLFHFDTIREFVYSENGVISGYIMPKYYKYIVDFYSMDTKDFLRIYKRLLSNVNELSKRHIFLNDMCYKNSLGYRNDIKMVDYDLYRRCKSSTLLSSNYHLLINFWNELFTAQRIINGYMNNITQKEIDGLFKTYSDNPYEVIDKVKKEQYVFYALKKR